MAIQAFNDSDYEEAVVRFLLCSSDPEVEYYLTLIYSDHSGSMFDIDKAYLSLIKSNDPRLCELANDIGKKYYAGTDCAIDLKKAFDCFKIAADMGNNKAMCNLAICYGRGKGVSKDRKISFIYYKKAADAGNAIAMLIYGKECLNVESDLYNPKIGIEYLTKAAESGNLEAQYELGVRYYKGFEVNPKVWTKN